MYFVAQRCRRRALSRRSTPTGIVVPADFPIEHGDDMALGLADRTGLACASTSGLGLATARALCEDGARVVVTSRSSERAEEVAGALPNATGIGCGTRGAG